MTHLRDIQVFGSTALAAGIVAALFVHRAPMRGWLGILLLVIASAAWALIDPEQSSQPSRLSMVLIFLFLAPVGIVYSFRARRLAPDRVIALAAFVGSFVVAAFVLFMLVGIVYSFFVS